MKKRQRSKHRANPKRRSRQLRLAVNGMRHDYASLEPRLYLAFTGMFDGTTLTLTQTMDDGDVVVDNNGTDDAFRTTDGSGTSEFDAATNVIVNLLGDTGNQLDFDLDNPHTGSAELNLGNGAERCCLWEPAMQWARI